MKVRRRERALIEWYADTLTQLSAALSPETIGAALEIAAAAAQIRGYEDLKLERAERVQAFVHEKLSSLISD